MDDESDAVPTSLMSSAEQRPRWRVGGDNPEGYPNLIIDRRFASGLVRIRWDRAQQRWTVRYYRSPGDYRHAVMMRTSPSYTDGGWGDGIDRMTPAPKDFAIDPDDPGAVLRLIEQTRDRELLEQPEAQRLLDRLGAAFTACVAGPGEPWESGDSLDLPDGGYVQWTRVAEPGTSLHVEVSDGTQYPEPLPSAVVSILADLGWERPNEVFRNAWAQGATEAERAGLAELVVRTLPAAFGVKPLFFHRMVKRLDGRNGPRIDD